MVYRKYCLRNGMDFPLAGVVAAVNIKGKAISDFRLRLTGVSSSPVVVAKACEIAGGKRLGLDLIASLADASYAVAHPAENLEANARRRRSMVRVMTEGILAGIANGLA